MSNTIKELITSRISTNDYDKDRILSDEKIKELTNLATCAPSAYHLQNWKFLAVRTPEAKERLKAVSYGQQKVVDASVTFIICGTLKAYEQLPLALKPSIDANLIDQSVLDMWVERATNSHVDNPVLQRDEAVRSASLAAMTLIIAAEGMGLATGAMSGFDPAGVAREFDLAPNELPVILVTVGYPATEKTAQKPRRPVSEILELV